MNLESFQEAVASVGRVLYLASSVEVCALRGDWDGNGHWYTAMFTHRDGSYAIFDATFDPETGAMYDVHFGDCAPNEDRLWFDAVAQELHAACRKAGYGGSSCWDERSAA